MDAQQKTSGVAETRRRCCGVVIPAKAGIQKLSNEEEKWIPSMSHDRSNRRMTRRGEGLPYLPMATTQESGPEDDQEDGGVLFAVIARLDRATQFSSSVCP